jgi:chromosome segregation ATPase
MNRHLEKLNLLGVVILAALCVAQWKINRDTNLRLQSAQKFQHEQTTKLSDQEKAIQNHLADLETFRTQLTATKARETELEKKLAESDQTNRQLTNERDQLKSTITNWAAAVETRDQQLRQAATNLQALIKTRDEAILKYNDLAKRHNELVTDLNRSRTNALAKTTNP